MRIRTEELTDFLYGGPYPKTYPNGLERILMRKLQMIKAARELRDLKIPPGNRLEPLKGNLKGYWSIRINQQWRLVFQWDDSNKEAIDVHFDDYRN